MLKTGFEPVVFALRVRRLTAWPLELHLSGEVLKSIVKRMCSPTHLALAESLPCYCLPVWLLQLNVLQNHWWTTESKCRSRHLVADEISYYVGLAVRGRIKRGDDDLQLDLCCQPTF